LILSPQRTALFQFEILRDCAQLVHKPQPHVVGGFVRRVDKGLIVNATAYLKYLLSETGTTKTFQKRGREIACVFKTFQFRHDDGNVGKSVVVLVGGDRPKIIPRILNSEKPTNRVKVLRN
jgi:hypothetical protein